jgi:hypothetical protein
MEGDRSVDHMAGDCSVRNMTGDWSVKQEHCGDEIVCSKIWPKMRFVGQYHMANLGRSKLGQTKSWPEIIGQKHARRLVGPKHGQNMARVWSVEIM